MTHLWTDVFSWLFAFASVFLVFVILLQRGRGGGLAGAFGAAGGQSAFGTKAGDVFTRITIGVFIVWLFLAVATSFAMTYESKGHFQPQAETVESGVVPAVPPKGAGAQTNPFEEGTQTAPPTKGTSGKESKSPASTTAPTRSSSSVTPPASTAPASNAKQTPAPTK